MTTYLLDVNVLVALMDPAHVQHEPAHDWFARLGRVSWATCPITENGLLRILGNSRYPNSPGTPADVAEMLTHMRALPGHAFWADYFSMTDGGRLDVARVLSHGQVTDSYLLALAKSRDGQLASFDRRLVVDAVIGGKSALHLI